MHEGARLVMSEFKQILAAMSEHSNSMLLWHIDKHASPGSAQLGSSPVYLPGSCPFLHSVWLKLNYANLFSHICSRQAFHKHTVAFHKGRSFHKTKVCGTPTASTANANWSANTNANLKGKLMTTDHGPKAHLLQLLLLHVCGNWPTSSMKSVADG